MHILLVDDAPDMCRSLQVLLNRVGYSEVSTAQSGATALEVLDNAAHGKTAPVDVVLLDIIMPHLNGIELCRRIKSRPEWRSIPILMLTALNDEVHLTEAFAAGAMDYLTKPIKFPELIARLESALSLKHELDTRQARERELLEVTEELHKANENLQKLASLDGLTGLANRRSLDGHLIREWRRCRRAETCLSLLMVDVDFFKAYNDHYGHQAGDECLRQIAGVLQTAVHRAGDMAARYGGEEFVLVLPDTDPRGLAAVAEEMRAKVEELALPHAQANAGPHVTISLGGASISPQTGGRPQDLMTLADQALYQAKGAGRNQVRLAASDAVDPEHKRRKSDSAVEANGALA